MTLNTNINLSHRSFVGGNIDSVLLLYCIVLYCRNGVTTADARYSAVAELFVIQI